jgi:3-hydroxymyristoyl/3-hydroxydecanoyl-(acyl carrier protein) dehydratase
VSGHFLGQPGVGGVGIALGWDAQSRYSGFTGERQGRGALVVADQQARFGRQLAGADSGHDGARAGAVRRREETELKRRRYHLKSPFG